MAGSSLLSERAVTLLNAILQTRWNFNLYLFMVSVVVLLRFSNRCLSCSDKSHSTTWLHPRTGEPVNSGHMIRSGTPRNGSDLFQNRRVSFFLDPLLQCVFCRVWWFIVCFAVVFVRVVDLPKGWEEGFTDEGASYFIK